LGRNTGSCERRGIAAVAQEIGLTKDTLRVWERRYGFPQSIRSRGGERPYPQEQMTELRLIKRLLDAGHRPSKVLGQSIDALQHLAESSGVGQDAPDSELDHLLELLRLNSSDDFRFALLKRGTRYELEKFVLDVAAPLSTRVGNAWAAGSLQVHHEHLFSESLQSTLRAQMRPLTDALVGRGGQPHERIAIETEIDHAKWLVWHGKGRQSVSRIKALDATLLAKEGYEYSTLYWNLRRLYFYIENSAGTLVNYGMRYYKGLPISSSIAESAVNLVVSHRMAKKQQMRWTDEGAHCLAQVRVAVLNDEFSVEKLAVLTMTSATANSTSARRAA
jgi:DNA-binding transcriptional MerR regulator